METNLNYIALLALIPALINLGLFIYAFYFLKNNKLVSVFSFMVLTCFIWQLSDGLTRIIDDIELLTRIYRILFFGVLFLLPTSVHFSLLYTNWLKKNKPSFFLTGLYLPSTIFYLCNLFYLPKGHFIHSNFWHFVYVPIGFLDNIILIWLGILGAITIYILTTYCYKIKKEDSKKFKGALLLAIGFSIPAVVAIITEVIFPIFFNTDGIPVATTFITAFSITSIYSLINFNYNLFDYNPFSVSEQIFDSISEGILITDNDGIIKYCNKSFFKNFGYSPADIINYPKSNLIVDPTNAIHFITKIGSQGNNIELKIYHKNGEKRDVLINRKPFYNTNNESIGIVSLILDITLLKDKEHELYKTQRQLLLSQKIAGIGFMSWQFSNNEIEISEVTKEIFGIEKNTTSINEFFLKSIIHSDDYEIVQNEIKQAKENKKQYHIEYRIINQKSKEIVWIKSQAELIYDDENNPTELIGTIIDITKSKNHEREYLTAMIKGEESEKNRIAQELHEGIAQYLAAINMNMNSIKDSIPQDVLEHYNNIQKLIIQTIQETRTISHNLIPKDMDLGLETALKHLSGLYTDKSSLKININFNNVNESSLSQFTRFNLYRISQEFVHNTFKHAKANHVTIDLANNENKIFFTLIDDGDGFEVNTKSKNGIGIKNITQRVKAIDGILTIESKQHQGTKFEIVLDAEHK